MHYQRINFNLSHAMRRDIIYNILQKFLQRSNVGERRFLDAYIRIV